ncbi:hypothetical protein F1529_00585 [Alcanivorax sp. VBW004]|uniref:hypothetical protein n=1 Tax=Alcanivorax sp. VBW004 TaxID=1287708 RepID=UPI0012BB9548|nr:hypothetical protein [Alcanivorax sp. VBW004]MTT50968.1 hypothetical protein [Alcanivorax sp. VBW004]
MKAKFLAAFGAIPLLSNAGVITCGDAMSVGSESRASLHAAAQSRAQNAAQEFMEKTIVHPYGARDSMVGGTPEKMTGTNHRGLLVQIG